MKVISDEDGITFVCMDDENSYFKLQDGKVQEVISDYTAFFTRKVEIEEVEEYLKNLKLFKMSALTKFFEKLVSKIVYQMDTPYTIDYEVEEEGFSIIVKYKISYKDVEENYTDRFYLNWNSRGVYIKWLQYITSTHLVYITSRNLLNRITYAIRTFLSRHIDAFACNYDRIIAAREGEKYIKLLSEKTGFEFKKGYWDGLYRAEKDGMIVTVRLGADLKSISEVSIDFTPGVSFSEIDRVAEAINLIKKVEVA